MPPREHQPRLVVALAVALALATAALFLPTLGNALVTYDDDVYLYENPHVRAGLTADSLTWAWSTFHAANYHPLTWMSHQLDATLFGLTGTPEQAGVWAGGHHLASILLHAASAVLLFTLLHRCTRAVWRPLAVAALFALHPLRVESVSWAAERKDVLSLCLGLLALHAYVSHARAPSPRRLAPVASLLALSLLAKPMLVTLPAVMLLMDHWPLERTRNQPTRPASLLLEKLPLLALVAASCVVTVIAQRAGGATKSLDAFPPGDRVANAVVAYAGYLRLLVWPTDLAVFYPWRGGLGAGAVAGSAALLVALSAAAVALRKRAPFLLVGWLWYLGALVPVIGLVQVGGQSMADRYTYFPCIGVLVAVVWGLHALLVREGSPLLPVVRAGFACAALGVGVTLAFLTWSQQQVWHNSETLYTHALRVAGPSRVVCYNLANYYQRSDPPRAIALYLDALEQAPRHPSTTLNLATTLTLIGQPREAERFLLDALESHPDSAPLLANLAGARLNAGRFAEAAQAAQRATQLEPAATDAWVNLGAARVALREPAAAETALRHALELAPGHPLARLHLARALTAQDRLRDAVAILVPLTRDAPDNADAFNALGIALARGGDLPAAAAAFTRAVELAPNNPDFRANLQRASAHAAPR